jgi:hypothetical protein
VCPARSGRAARGPASGGRWRPWPPPDRRRRSAVGSMCIRQQNGTERRAARAAEARRARGSGPTRRTRLDLQCNRSAAEAVRSRWSCGRAAASSTRS